ncbi:MAG: methylmalonyl-CoA mutase family protein, partial [bacterium]
VAIQALAAVLGGTQSLHTNSLDEALGLPTEKSVQIALRTQQIIAYESGVTNTVDPLGGSYYLEYLTDQIEKRVQDYLERIKKMGSMVEAIEQGYVQREIQASAYKYQKSVESGERIIVGLNKFRTEEELPHEILQVDPQLRERQIQRLQEIKERRDNQRVSSLLKKIEEVASTSENLMPYFIEAVKAYATLGEITGALRRVFGEYQQQVIF